MAPRESACPLCLAVSDVAGSRPENSHLFETPNYIVMPCIGPLVPGHLMVVSRGHFPSLGAMGTFAIAEYELLAKRLRAAAIFSTGALEAEHGGTTTDCGGACVLHTHIHWLPGLGGYDEAFEGVLPAATEAGSEIASITKLSVPYVSLRGTTGRLFVYVATELPSQVLRQLICSQLGRQDWDWRVSRRDDWISQTLAMWKSGGLA